MRQKKRNQDLSGIIERGFERMSSSRVAICGLARDCAPTLRHIAPRLAELGSRFKSYRVIVVENDSTDESAQVLEDLTSRNHRFDSIRFNTCPWVQASEAPSKHENWWFSAPRMTRMNFARNLYLEAVEKLDGIDLVIVVDLDILSFSIPGIAHTLGADTAWDFVASNGQRYTLRHPLKRQVYWDTYVYEPFDGFPAGILRSPDIRRAQTRLTRKLKDLHMLPVRSAFGGLCVYRYGALRHHRYTVIANDDPEVSVLCDHNTLHRSMAASGFTKGFINPLQTVEYETLSNTLSRMLKRL